MSQINDITPLLDRDLIAGFAAVSVPAELPSPVERRVIFRQLMAAYRGALPPPDSVIHRDAVVPASFGDVDVPVRIFAPREPRCDAVLLWLHGGGFSVGHHEDEDVVVAPWVDAIGCTVVSVGYRLVPEHTAPAALNDACAALRWIATAPAELGVRPSRIAVGGISAGGTLAAGVALRARDEQGPALCFQLLLVPAADNRSATPSMQTLNDPRQWNLDANLLAWQMYAGGDGAAPAHCAPGRSDDLSNLPPAYVEVAGADPLRDEGIAFAQKLMQAGVATELHVFPGAYHASSYVQPLAPVSRRAREETIAALQRAFSA
jgi:acetyl esterase/lipase